MHDGLGIEEDIAGYEYMNSGGKRYLCGIPRVLDEEDEPPSNSTKEERDKELTRATERGWQLLKGMEGTCIYFVSGWWSYSFCFNEGVKQFHQLSPGSNVPAYPPVEDKTVASYMLGRVDTAQRKLEGKKNDKSKPSAERELAMPKMQIKGDTSYLVQELKGGTECDLTGKDRRIEIQVRIMSVVLARLSLTAGQFHCEQSTGDRITVIKEIATCQYLMVISTPRLCNDLAFAPPDQKFPNQIVCTRVMPAASIPSYIAEKEAEADKQAEKQELFADKMLDKLLQGLETGQVVITEEDLGDGSFGDSAKLVVGDIVVGGHKVVPPGKTLEKSIIVGGGKETFIATIAKSSGFIASEEELKKLNIHNARNEIEGVKAELEKLAQGKSWRLDVVETPRGRELRGIIDTEDQPASPGRVQISLNDDQGDDEHYNHDDGHEDLNKLRENRPADSNNAPMDDTDDGERGDDGSEETYKEEL
jgi:protein OS-9